MSEIENEDQMSDDDITALIAEQDEEIKNLKKQVADLEAEKESKSRIGQPVEPVYSWQSKNDVHTG